MEFFTDVDISTVILAIVAIILGIQQWRSGSSSLATSTISAYKEQLQITEKRYKDQQEAMIKQINEQAGQIGELRGLVIGKDKQIADYKQILENRNPNP